MKEMGWLETIGWVFVFIVGFMMMMTMMAIAPDCDIRTAPMTAHERAWRAEQAARSGSVRTRVPAEVAAAARSGRLVPASSPNATFCVKAYRIVK